METTNHQASLDHIIQALENKEQMDSLYYLVQKLPEFTNAIQSMEDKLSFLTSVMQDKESLHQLGNEVEQKVEQLHINQAHLDALLQIVHLLPSLVPMMKRLDEIIAFATDFLGDQQSIEYTLNGLNDVVPIQETVEVIQETNQRFRNNQDNTSISLYGMYRLLKDPTVQKGFRYVETLLQVIQNRTQSMEE